MTEAAIILLLLFLWVFISWLLRTPTPRPEDRGPTWSYRPSLIREEALAPEQPRPESKEIYDFKGIVSPSDVVRTKEGVTELDLHGLRVWEAKEVTLMFLKQSRDYFRRVRVITGRGLHSIDGTPKIKPEVENLLRNNSYKFKEMYEGGCLEVKL